MWRRVLPPIGTVHTALHLHAEVGRVCHRLFKAHICICAIVQRLVLALADRTEESPLGRSPLAQQTFVDWITPMIEFGRDEIIAETRRTADEG